MDIINTYFWEDRIVSKTNLRLRQIFNWRPSFCFSTGNAGDIFAQNILKYKYDCSLSNTADQNRLLCIGSIGHKIQMGDVLCGIGTKGLPIPKGHSESCSILGLRGPITYDCFKDAGYDMSNVKFLLDPGLLIRFLISEEDKNLEAEDIIFIPHYRERDKYRRSLKRGIKYVNIDSDPMEIARSILKAKLVYSSSLHGIIFAHALNRPCIFVKPQTNEGELKYKDYYSSVGLDYQKPLDNINCANFLRDSDTPFDIKYKESDFCFPTIEELRNLNISKEIM